MLSYLDTIERLTSLRDGLRKTLDSAYGDRQSTLELTEMTLTKLLGELVTPDAPADTIVSSLEFVDPTKCPNPWHKTNSRRASAACPECPSVLTVNLSV